jgi:hypothetical protein
MSFTYDVIYKSPNFGYPKGREGRGGHEIIAIGLHITGAAWESNYRWIMNSAANAGYNAVVRDDGSVVSLVPEENAAYSHGRINRPTWPLLKKGVNPNLYTLSVARTVVVPEVWKVFCGFDLAVLINKSLYEGTDEDGKQALVDYSLSNITFCRKDGVYRWRLKKPDIVEHSAVLKRSGICMSRWRAFDEKEMEQMSFLDMSKTIDDTYAAEILGSGKPKEAPEVVNYCVELEEVTEEDLLPDPGEEVQVLYEAAPPAEVKSEGGGI